MMQLESSWELQIDALLHLSAADANTKKAAAAAAASSGVEREAASSTATRSITSSGSGRCMTLITATDFD